MHWRHVSITTTPCWGSRLVALRARVVLAERICAQPLSQCAGPGHPSGMACRGWPSGCMLGDGARGSATFDPQRGWAPFCDVICIRSIQDLQKANYTSFIKCNFMCLQNIHHLYPQRTNQWINTPSNKTKTKAKTNTKNKTKRKITLSTLW